MEYKLVVIEQVVEMSEHRPASPILDDHAFDDSLPGVRAETHQRAHHKRVPCGVTAGPSASDAVPAQDVPSRWRRGPGQSDGQNRRRRAHPVTP